MMCTIRGVLAVLTFLAVLPESIHAQPVPADLPLGLRVVPSITGRGDNLKSAVEGSKSLMEWLHGRAVDAKILASLSAQNDHIRHMLTNTGQPGVLAFVEIERANNETGMHDLVGDRVQVIGAGTEPGKIAIAYAQLNNLKPLPRPGSKIDEDASFYYWITREGDGIKISTNPASMIRLQVAHAFQDKAYLATLNEQSPAQAMQIAIAHLQANLTDAEQKARLTTLRREHEQRQQNIKDIEKRLETELERAKRLRRASAFLSAMAGVGTLANQIAAFKGALGKDAPASIDGVQSVTELSTIADKLVAAAEESGGKLRVQYAETQNLANGTRLEILNVMRKNSYPTGGVPQLAKPENTLD